MPPELILALVFILAFALSGKARRASRDDPLDQVMFTLPDGTPYTKRMLMQSVAILGAAGSGKSSGSGLFFALALVQMRGSGGLILASKPEDREWWEKLFARCGRSDDLLIFSPNHKLRFNVLEAIGGDTRNITHFLMTVREIAKGGDKKGGEEGGFWEEQGEKHIGGAVEVVRQGGEDITTAKLADFIGATARDPLHLRSEAQIVGKKHMDDWSPMERNAVDGARRFRAGFHYKMFAEADARKKTQREQFDYEQATRTWITDWPVMDNKLRSSITAEIQGTLNLLNSGVVRELLGTETNVSPAVMRKGKWVLVDMPPKEWGESGRVVNAIWKYATQRDVLRYKAVPGDQSSVTIWSDEYQNLINSYDAVYLAECRSHLGNMVVLTQSIHSFYSSMGGAKGNHFVDALLTNFGTKIFHTLGDAASAQYASSLLGAEIQTIVNLTPNDDVMPWEELTGVSRMKPSYNRSWAPKLQPSAFLSGLRCGGADGIVDGILIRAGEPMRGGQNYQYVAFDQNA